MSVSTDSAKSVPAATYTVHETVLGSRVLYTDEIGLNIFSEKYQASGSAFLSCVVCARDTSKKGNSQGVIVAEGGSAILHSADNEIEQSDGGYMGWFPIGSECIKKVPAEYRVANPYHDKIKGVNNF